MLGRGQARKAASYSLAATLVLLCSVTRLAHSPEQQTLGLTATVENGRVVLAWNPNARPIPTARTAVLSITDAGRSESIELNLTALRSARLAYKPIGTDVTFRLAVPDEEGGTVAEAVRVIMRGNPQPPGWHMRPLRPAPVQRAV